MSDNAKVTRFEVIDHRKQWLVLTDAGPGRAFVAYDAAITLSYQDGGRTLKVFIDDQKSDPGNKGIGGNDAR